MNSNQRPRHIRDIAHLYISRSTAKSVAERKRVYIVAASRECFGGYHAANIALGFCQQGYAVRLMELSRKLPSSAYFLRLPPSVYLRQRSPGRERLEAFSAMSGVMVRFDAPTGAVPEVGSVNAINAGLRRRSAGAVDVYHLPPASENESLVAVLDEISEQDPAAGGARAIVSAFSRAEADEVGNRVFSKRPRVNWKTLSLGERSSGDGGSRHLGYLVGWRSLLADPLPCVTRDPESHVSRSYISVCDAILAQGSTAEGKHERKTKRQAASASRFR